MHQSRTVLHTIETTGIGGAETVMLGIATSLDPTRFRSIAVVPAPGALQDALEAGGVRTHVVASHRWWDLRLPAGLARLCRSDRVDLIHAHLPEHAFAGCVAGAIMNRPVVATYHGNLDFRRADDWRGALKLGVVRRQATVAVGVCDSVHSTLIDKGFPEERVRRIYNGVDIIAARGATSAGLRERFGWPHGTPLVGTVANVRVTKGYEYFVRAARLVINEMPHVRFVAAGDIDPSLGPGLQALIKDLDLDEQVRLLGFRADALNVIQDLDVYLLSSTSEGFPLVLLNAMAAGKPIVATRCGGPEEILWDGANGHLVEVRDPVALADRVLRVLRDHPHAMRIGAAAASDAADYTIDAMVYEYQELYDTVLRA